MLIHLGYGQASGQAHSGDHSLSGDPQASAGLGASLPLWLGYWSLCAVQLLAYALYSRLQRRFATVRVLFGTPYRASRIGERFLRHSNP